MKFKWILLFASVLTLSAFAEDVFLRIQSDAENSGARIFINGTFKGECPLDVAVEAGTLEIEAIKTVDSEYEQRWSQTLHMGEGAIKRIQVQLSGPVLTEQALMARYEKTKAAAERGTIEAMFKLADLYEQGVGTEINIKLAQQWQRKAEDTQEAKAAQSDLSAAKNGDIPAMERIVVRYENGQGLGKNNAKAEEWRNTLAAAKEKARLNKAREEEELRQQKLRNEAEEKRSRLQSELDSIDYLDHWHELHPEHAELTNLLIITIYPCGLTVGGGFLIMDILSSPTKLTEEKKLTKQLESHAAAWGNPESMMGKVHESSLETESYEVEK